MHVSKITIGRLFNLGNYEHVRYEIAADLQPGENPREAVEKLNSAINAIGEKCPIEEYELRSAQEAIDGPVKDSADQWEMDMRADAISTIGKFNEWTARQKVALENFEKLSGTATN